MSANLINRYTQQYMNTLAGDGEFARNTARFRKNQTTPNLMMPYSTAPINTNAYTLAQSLVEEPVNPLDFYQSPDALTSASNALSYGIKVVIY